MDIVIDYYHGLNQLGLKAFVFGLAICQLPVQLGHFAAWIGVHLLLDVESGHRGLKGFPATASYIKKIPRQYRSASERAYLAQFHRRIFSLGFQQKIVPFWLGWLFMAHVVALKAAEFVNWAHSPAAG
jgi:hypothetical protein